MDIIILLLSLLSLLPSLLFFHLISIHGSNADKRDFHKLGKSLDDNGFANLTEMKKNIFFSCEIKRTVSFRYSPSRLTSGGFFHGDHEDFSCSL